MNDINKYGVRIYPKRSGPKILIKQTVKRPDRNNYVIDMLENDLHREAFVDIDNDADIAEAVRQALRGVLNRSI